MSQIINAKGLACPQPVILTKKALEAHSDIVVLVDNMTAMENVKRYASNSGCSVEIADEPEGVFKIHLKKQSGATPGNLRNLPPEYPSCDADARLAAAGPTVFVIASDTMGRGNDELGAVLMKVFIHTSTELQTGPHVMIFYNAGVKLTSEGSDVLDDLKKLEEKGVKMLVCGTCVDYFGLTGKVVSGVVSNMYDIADILSHAGRIVQP
jgi:selenium metabolism protein YedF